MEKEHSIRKRILFVIVIILIAIIPLCFLYSLVQLIIKPAKIVVVENRKDI